MPLSIPSRARDENSTPIETHNGVGIHFAVTLLAAASFAGPEFDLFGRDVCFVLCGVALATWVLIRPRWLVTADGVDFRVRVLYLFDVSYAKIPRTDIHAVLYGWDREQTLNSHSGVVYSYASSKLGVFLRVDFGDPPMTSRFSIWESSSGTDLEVAKTKAEEFARVLGCSVEKTTTQI
ncbi:MAG: hypothetical protein AAF517_00430 [Planctomycetota bacterium]